MSAEDKIKNSTQKVVGKAKEATGHVTGNDRLIAEGKADQTKAQVKKTAEDLKDVFKK